MYFQPISINLKFKFLPLLLQNMRVFFFLLIFIFPTKLHYHWLTQAEDMVGKWNI